MTVISIKLTIVPRMSPGQIGKKMKMLKLRGTEGSTLLLRNYMNHSTMSTELGKAYKYISKYVSVSIEAYIPYKAVGRIILGHVCKCLRVCGLWQGFHKYTREEWQVITKLPS